MLKNDSGRFKLLKTKDQNFLTCFSFFAYTLFEKAFDILNEHKGERRILSLGFPPKLISIFGEIIGRNFRK
jgi:hypothetical protein